MVKFLIGPLSIQGDIQGPPIFKCLSELWNLFGRGQVHKAISHGAVLQNELKVEDEIVVMDNDYADDLAVMDNTEEGLQESTDLIAYYTSYAGLKINANKTQCMAISKCASQRPYTERDSIKLTVEGNLLCWSGQ